ncbi:MAG: hypothetical protein NTX61_01190 [Bacteroidetes bacterium]|nr:hypothetical protein [Bacteroidota bacterium]
MNPIPERILKFISEHHIFTLAVSEERGPWCATCFYTYIKERNQFIFTSEPDTRHIISLEREGTYAAAGAIALETKMIGKIRGIQFTGEMKKPEGNDFNNVKAAYLKTFPIARFATLYLWTLVPDYIKMTDNRLGFGKKLIWKTE